jgi:dTDP-glucose 4,6-dehydratase
VTTATSNCGRAEKTRRLVTDGVGSIGVDAIRHVPATTDDVGHDRLEHVADRPGHDQRDAVDAGHILAPGWSPRLDLEAALDDTIAWYRAHED